MNTSTASTVQYCYNSVNVISNGTWIGGICGYSTNYCTVKDSYISNAVKVTKGTKTSTTATASSNLGASSNYLRKNYRKIYSYGS